MLNIHSGLRVIRGPHWKWADEDGGDGWLGTVHKFEPKPNNGTPQVGLVSVLWDFHNKKSLYRVGDQNSYDLLVYDSGPVGVRHTEYCCDGCGNSTYIIGTRYSCTECSNVDLCGACYNSDQHNLEHSFSRIDTPNSPSLVLPPRSTSRKITVKGFLVGAKVMRGVDWEWNTQDGGPKKTGRIIGILDGKPNESFRSIAKVLWSSGKENNYRIGLRGKIDLKCIVSGTVSFCYKDHLPVLGKPFSDLDSTMNVFRRGDRVLLNVNAEELKFIQQQRERGGWNPYMIKFIGQAGTVHRVTEQGSVRIKFDDCENKWTFDPRALCKVVGFCVGDYVRFINNEQKAKDCLRGRGGWIDSMRKDLGSVGLVIKVYEDEDVRVAFDDKSTWTLSPQCLELVKRCIEHTREAMLVNGCPSTSHASSPEERSNISTFLTEMNTEVPSSHSSERQSSLNTLRPEEFPDACVKPLAITSPPMNSLPSLYNPKVCAPLILEVMREMVEGNPQSLDNFVANHPQACDCSVAGGKTLLHIAAFQGYVSQIETLIANNARIHSCDDTGDTVLHFAAHGNQPGVVQCLLSAGASIDAQNRSGQTPLHVAVNKNLVEFVKTLIKHGCNVNVQDNNLDTPLHDAVVRSSEEILSLFVHHPNVDLYIENATGFNVLNQAVLRGNIPALETLLSKNATLASVPKSSDGFTPLHVASCNGLFDIVKLLVEKYFVNINALDLKNKTPLFAAIARGQLNIIHYLVIKEASLELYDNNHNSVLHTLFIKRNSFKDSPNEVTEPLIYEEYIEAGGSRTDNATLIAVAVFLIQHGASLDYVNHANQKPFDLILRDSQLIDKILELTRLDLLEQNSNLVTGVSNIMIEEHVVPAESIKTSNPAPVECTVCSELGVANVILRPCLHAVACEECSSRMKKCIQCKTLISERISVDGRIVPSQERHEKSKIERVNYLESKINQIEEMNTCSICMERCKNTIFLCGHGSCEICAKTLKQCHMCRQVIKQRINVFL